WGVNGEEGGRGGGDGGGVGEMAAQAHGAGKGRQRAVGPASREAQGARWGEWGALDRGEKRLVLPGASQANAMGVTHPGSCGSRRARGNERPRRRGSVHRTEPRRRGARGGPRPLSPDPPP